MENERTYRYFLQLCYEGSSFHGWQIQPNGNSVQQTLNTALQTLLRDPAIHTVGAGRTDTGVHALNYTAHFDCSCSPETLEEKQLVYKLNRILPPTISVQGIRRVNQDAHARFDAQSRAYQYLIATRKNPFANQRAWIMERSLDKDLMNEACQLLFQYTDFSSFSKSNTQVKTNNCNIRHAAWTEQQGLLIFTIQADRFLRNMVRAIVGTLVDMGMGKINVVEFAQIIESKDRSRAGYSVPAQGLYFMGANYPSGLFIASVLDQYEHTSALNGLLPS